MCSAINGVCNYFLSGKINDEQKEHTLGFDQNAAEKRRGKKLRGKAGGRRRSDARENPKAVMLPCKP